MFLKNFLVTLLRQFSHFHIFGRIVGSFFYSTSLHILKLKIYNYRLMLIYYIICGKPKKGLEIYPKLE